MSFNGRTLASGSQKSNNTIIWDVATEQQQQSLPISGFESGLTFVDFSPDGHTLVSGSSDGVVDIWDTSKWQLLRTLC